MNGALKNKGKKSDLKNWNISILNVDYKIISKVLTKRLRKLIQSVIDEDQTCGVQGRNIQENVTVLRDVIDYVNMYNKNVAIISIDKDNSIWSFRMALYIYICYMDQMGVSGLTTNTVFLTRFNALPQNLTSFSEQRLKTPHHECNWPIHYFKFALCTQKMQSTKRTCHSIDAILILFWHTMQNRLFSSRLTVYIFHSKCRSCALGKSLHAKYYVQWALCLYKR